MNEKFAVALASALQIDAAEFTALLKNGEEWLPEAELSGKIQSTVSARLKEAKEAQHKRGVREQSEKAAKQAKKLGFENPEKLFGEEFWEAFEGFLSERTSSADPTKLSPDELAKLPTVKALIKSKQDAAAAEMERQISGYKSEVADLKGRAHKGEIRAEYVGILDRRKAALEGSGISREKRLDRFDQLVPYASLTRKDGKTVVLDENGEEKTDSFGKPVTFESLIVGINDDLFGWNTSDPKKNGAPPPGGQKAEAGGYTFADENDFNARVGNELSGTKRLEMYEAWDAQSKEK